MHRARIRIGHQHSNRHATRQHPRADSTLTCRLRPRSSLSLQLAAPPLVPGSSEFDPTSLFSGSSYLRLTPPLSCSCHNPPPPLTIKSSRVESSRVESSRLDLTWPLQSVAAQCPRGLCPAASALVHIERTRCSRVALARGCTQGMCERLSHSHPARRDLPACPPLTPCSRYRGQGRTAPHACGAISARSQYPPP